MAMIAYICATRAIPALEQYLLNQANEAVEQISDTPIAVTVSGYQATLSGAVASDEQRSTLLAAVSVAPGVRYVIDQLTTTEAASKSDTLTVNPTESTDESAVEPALGGTTSAVAGADVVNSSASTDSPENAATALGLSGTADAENTPVAELDENASDVTTIKPDELQANSSRDNAISDSNTNIKAEAEAEATSPAKSSDASDTRNAVDRPDANGKNTESASDSEHTESAEISTTSDQSASLNTIVSTELADRDSGTGQSLRSTATAAPDSEPPAADSSADIAALRKGFTELPKTGILFQTGNDILTVQSRQVLDSIAQLFRRYPNIPVDIDGHTDAAGATDTNLSLSQVRANTVRDYLVDQGVSTYRLTAYGFGESIPIADNSTREGRAANRRIEFNF